MAHSGRPAAPAAGAPPAAGIHHNSVGPPLPTTGRLTTTIIINDRIAHMPVYEIVIILVLPASLVLLAVGFDRPLRRLSQAVRRTVRR